MSLFYTQKKFRIFCLLHSTKTFLIQLIVQPFVLYIISYYIIKGSLTSFFFLFLDDRNNRVRVTKGSLTSFSSYFWTREIIELRPPHTRRFFDRKPPIFCRETSDFFIGHCHTLADEIRQDVFESNMPDISSRQKIGSDHIGNCHTQPIFRRRQKIGGFPTKNRLVCGGLKGNQLPVSPQPKTIP